MRFNSAIGVDNSIPPSTGSFGAFFPSRDLGICVTPTGIPPLLLTTTDQAQTWQARPCSQPAALLALLHVPDSHIFHASQRNAWHSRGLVGCI